MSEERKDLTITDDLKPVLEMLKPDDASAVVELREELADNWQKKQIFRTETEMRISVLNDAKHPTNASKYWQSVREQGAMFDALLGLTFDLRRNKLARRKLEQEQKEYELEGIHWEYIPFNDNIENIQLISGKMGIFKILDEQCKVPNGNDNTFLQRMNQNFKNSKYYSYPNGIIKKDIIEKLNFYSHYERLSEPSLGIEFSNEYINECIKNRKDIFNGRFNYTTRTSNLEVLPTNLLPKFIQNNLEKYKEYLA